VGEDDGAAVGKHCWTSMSRAGWADRRLRGITGSSIRHLRVGCRNGNGKQQENLKPGEARLARSPRIDPGAMRVGGV